MTSGHPEAIDAVPAAPSINATSSITPSGGKPYVADESQAFKAFSPTHFVTLGVCVLLIVALVIAGRWLRPKSGPAPGSPIEIRRGMIIDPAGRLLGVLGLFSWMAWQMWWAMPSQFDAAEGLPLHICDLAGLFAAIALITGSRLFTTVLFFWGIGLSTQAYFTPIVPVGPLFTKYWLFWESHTLIIGSAVYVVAVRGYRPNSRDFRDLVLFTFGYLFIILPIDLAMGWNYGYVGNGRPESTTLIDKLGAWPLRLVPLILLTNAAFFIVWLPFLVLNRRRSVSLH